MSSTNRGGQRSPADNYPTPAWCVHRLLEGCREFPREGSWLEPCAGDGAIIQAIQATGLVPPEVAWTAVELREECRGKLAQLVKVDAVVIDDLLTLEWDGPKFDVAITNPPFSLAMPIIQRLWTMANHVLVLERLNFLGTPGRAAVFRERMPDVYVLPDRVSFTADGRADSIEYAWFHWGPYANAGKGRILLLEHTPRSERAPGREEYL